MEIKIEIDIPKNWNELNDWQLLKISGMLHKKGAAFDFMTWMYLNQVKWWQFKRAYQLRLVLNEVPLSTLKEHFVWIYKQVDRTIFPKHKRLTAPMDRLVNLTIEEFALADDMNNLYLQTKKVMYLQLLCAILYREKDESYNHLHLEQVYLKRFKYAPVDFLFAVHLAFNGCKSNIVGKYKNIYPTAKKVQKSNKKSGFLDVVLKMSGQKFGTYNETKSTLVYTFLNELEESIIQQKELKEHYGKKGHA